MCENNVCILCNMYECAGGTCVKAANMAFICKNKIKMYCLQASSPITKNKKRA